MMNIHFTSGCPRKPLITLKKHQIEHEFKLFPEIGHDTMWDAADSTDSVSAYFPVTVRVANWYGVR